MATRQRIADGQKAWPECWRRSLAWPSPPPSKPGRMAIMREIMIRPARPGDARDISRLDIETWRTTYAGILPTAYLVGLSERRREAGWRGVILQEARDVRVAVDAAGAIVGFGSC